ncbi:hypothetical protein EZ449_08830 [Pedobacter frigidisoli]|uniref:Signal transduction histidine kinase internal region domain-containing protein n=1 Tax=Pedobacter frigidisoli TaxID=2530455 RepID=A0A4R0P129_9SPHI|nr:histidine kinase [Pedobacter frigidisoli]TCD10445.1 hypothetical protein EZ449_08830 [Pedobacter frigidisoli]
MKPNIETQYKPNTILKWISNKKLHILVWLIFVTYESLIVGIFSGRFAQLNNYILYYSLNISLFYVHAHLVLTNALKDTKKAWWKIPLFILFELIAYMLVTACLDYIIITYTNYTGTRKLGFNLLFFAGPIYRAIYFMCFSTGYYFLLNFLMERKKTEDLEKQRLNNVIQIARSENAFLKAQIQPHLLFNTLDFIYQNARESSPIAAETIHSLSEMMRYSVDSNKDRDFIPLSEEINQVENLINLHQLRKDHSIQIRFWYDDEIRNIKIIPLILITLVENMFKHGNLTLQSNPAEIKITRVNGKLVIETSNLIKETLDNTGLNAGIENIKKRLYYTYQDKADFSYFINQDIYFKVILSIELSPENQI